MKWFGLAAIGFAMGAAARRVRPYVSRKGIKLADDPYDRYTLSWADVWCQTIHHYLFRSWALSGAGMGLPGYGPKEECLRCRRAWGTAWN